MDYIERLRDQFPDVARNYPRVFGSVAEWVRLDVNERAGMIVVEAQPGNGTRYGFVLLVLCDTDVPDWGLPQTAYLLAMDPNHYAWKRTMSISGPKIHPSYIMEKLGMGEPDVVAMSIILWRVWERMGS